MLETGNLPEGVEASDEIAKILKPQSGAVVLVVFRDAEEAALIEARLPSRLHPFVQYLWPTD